MQQPLVIQHVAVPHEAPGVRPACPACHRLMRDHGTVRLVLHDLPRGRQPVLLHLTATDWRCPDRCATPGPFDQLRRQGERATKLTRRLHDHLLESWLRGQATRRLAWETALSETYLRGLLNEALGVTGRPPHPLVNSWRKPEMLSDLQYVGIDDLFWRQRPLVVVVDLRPDDPVVGRSSQVNRDHRLIDVLPSRDPALVAQFLRELNQAKAMTGTPGWRPAIATDMWSDFRTAIQRVFQGRAIHVADRFHLSAKVLEDLHEVTAELTRRSAQSNGASERQALQALSRGQQEVKVAYLSGLRQRHQRSLTVAAQTTSPESAPQASSLQAVDLAVRFHDLWNDQTPLQATRTFQAWREEVTRWGRATGVRRPFGRLIHLLDREGWLLETVNAHRPQARPALSVLSPEDLARLQVPAARPTFSRLPGETLLSTARVESLNRRIREMERHSPNHRRLPVASTDWRHWGEEVRFRRYRARLLFALNTRPAPPAHLVRPLLLSPDVCCGAVPEIRATTTCKAFDLPLRGARVTAQWREGEAICGTCGRLQVLRLPDTEVTDEAGPAMRPALLAYLLRALSADHTLTGLKRETGVPTATLRALRSTLPAPEVALPRRLGTVPFFWRRHRCLLVTDIDTGRPVELLRSEGGHFGPEHLQDWLTRPECAHVEQVWVEKPEWIPEHVTEVRGNDFPTFRPVLPRRVLDPFASSRLLQRRLNEALQEYTAQMDVGLRRARRKYRLTLVSNPDEQYWSVDERLRGTVRQDQWRRLTQDEGLQYALLRLWSLKDQLRSDPEQAAALFRQWSSEVSGLSTHGPALISQKRLGPLHRTLDRTVSQIAPDQAVTDALILGVQLAYPPEGEGITLARSRRRMRDLRDLSAYRTDDWAQLRRVALTQVGA